MQLKYLVAAFASLAFASAIALPEPQDASPTFVCGCTNACKLANKPGIACLEWCDPKYFCTTTTTTTTPTKPTTTTATPKPTFICGCTNDCEINCPPGKACPCPLYCDPKYECTLPTIRPTRVTLPTIQPTRITLPTLQPTRVTLPTLQPTRVTLPTPRPTFKCGCTNDCIVNCPPGESCICPQYCDPKYACPTLLTKRSIVIPTPITTGIPCGCHNDCTIKCGRKAGCVCPAYCDPKYMCKAVA